MNREGGIWLSIMLPPGFFHAVNRLLRPALQEARPLDVGGRREFARMRRVTIGAFPVAGTLLHWSIDIVGIWP
jgi:hypothetical protein